jgi:probable F420-dependent oxidoreductase
MSPAVRVGVHLPQYGQAASSEAISQAARHAEDLGFADVWVSDHTVHPAAQDYPTPYLYDPLLTLAWAGAVTQRVGLGTSVLVVPTHNPLGLANSLASLDSLSGGRVIVGAGVGWSEAEYAALGQDFHTRGRRFDEAIDLFRVAWRDDPITFRGEFTSFEDIRLLPKPAGAMPIWIGGSSDAAFRRAAAHGNGMQLIGMTPDQARPAVARIREARPEPSFTLSLRTGWDPQGMEPGRIRDELSAYEEAGIQHVVSAPWRRDLADWLRSMDLLADIVR